MLLFFVGIISPVSAWSALDVPYEEVSVPGSGPSPAKDNLGTAANSVVKVFSTVRYPDPYKPWTRQVPVAVTGSGVVIEGKRILSNAHVVLYASQGSPDTLASWNAKASPGPN